MEIQLDRELVALQVRRRLASSCHLRAASVASVRCHRAVWKVSPRRQAGCAAWRKLLCFSLVLH